MLIDDYFTAILQLVEDHPSVESHTLRFEKRTEHTGYIRRELVFRDAKVLHIREFVDLDAPFPRLLYAYQFMSPADTMLFRYDNSGHHKGVDTFPHHKHVAGDKAIEASSAPTLKAVLDEVDLFMDFKAF